MSDPIDFSDLGDELSDAERDELLSDPAAIEHVVRQLQALPRIAVPADFRARVMAGVVSEAPAAAEAAPAPEAAEEWDPDQVLAESPGLQRVVERLRALPRLLVPRGFLSRVLSEIDELELERKRNAHRERLERGKGGGWQGKLLGLSQAAGFLLLIGLGASWTAPAPQSLTSSRNYRAQRWDQGAEKAAFRSVTPDADPSFVALPAPPYDATVELSAGGDLTRAGNAVGNVVTAYAASIEGQRTGEGDMAWGWVAYVRADRTDDLLRALEATSEVRVDAEDQRALLHVNREQDLVELKSGVIYVGRAQERGREVVLTTGSLERRFPKQKVLDTRSASELRRVRIDLRR